MATFVVCIRERKGEGKGSVKVMFLISMILCENVLSLNYNKMRCQKGNIAQEGT